MRLNTQTDYALRLLMHLAVQPDELYSIATIAEKFNISRNHLIKIAQALNSLGIVETIRGRSGGVKLAKPANKIGIGMVVRNMENDLALVECFKGRNGSCQIQPACRLKSVLSEALDAFLSHLDQYSVGDLVSSNNKLAKLLMVK